MFCPPDLVSASSDLALAHRRRRVPIFLVLPEDSADNEEQKSLRTGALPGRPERQIDVSRYPCGLGSDDFRNWIVTPAESRVPA